MQNNREQRDLAWCIRQPAIVRGAPVFPEGDWFAEQQIPARTRTEPPPERFRLGIHFERIYQRWLEAHAHYELVASNLQVQGEQRTLGEFDLLVNLGDRTEHWELAIKFYINISEPQRSDRWFGPDPHDTLYSKFSRLESHQLKLAEHPDAQQLLKSRGIHVQATRCIVKGRLYHPWQEQHHVSNNKALPDIVNPDHLKGWWITQEDINKLAGCRVAYLEKRYWLSPATSDDALEVMGIEALSTFLSETKQIAPQFALLDSSGAEISRGFVLKPQWFELIEQGST